VNLTRTTQIVSDKTIRYKRVWRVRRLPRTRDSTPASTHVVEGLAKADVTRIDSRAERSKI